MIKRALGVFGNKAANEDSDDEELNEKDRRRLEKRLLPGGGVGSSKTQAAKKAATQSKDEEEEDEDDDADDKEQEADEEEAEEAGSDGAESDGDSDPVVPPEADQETFRGNFRCQLCPHKVLLTEKAMEEHLQSTSHKRNERRYMHAKEIGLEAYQAECRQRAEARARIAQDIAAGMSKKKQKNYEYWKKKREKQLEINKRRKKENSQELSNDEVQALKNKFQEKKARRLERRAAAEAEGVDRGAKTSKNGPTSEQAVSESKARPLNRKERRALKFGHTASPVGVGVDANNPAEEQAQKAKKKAKSAEAADEDAPKKKKKKQS